MAKCLQAAIYHVARLEIVCNSVKPLEINGNLILFAFDNNSYKKRIPQKIFHSKIIFVNNCKTL